MAIVTIEIVGWIVDDDLVETTLTFAAAFITFYVAEDVIEVSGVLAVVTLGVCFAAFGRTKVSPSSQHLVQSWWRMLSYIGNTLIFLIVGLVMVLRNDFSKIEGRDWGMIFLLWFFLYIIRAIMLVILWPLNKWLGYTMSWQEMVISTHGGLRGAVSLALALAVSLDTGYDGDQLPLVVRDKTLFYAGAVAILTLLFNATTTPLLINRLGLTKEPAGQKYVFEQATALLHRYTLRQAERLSRDKLFSMCNWDEALDFVLPRLKSGSNQPMFKVSHNEELVARIVKTRCSQQSLFDALPTLSFSCPTSSIRIPQQHRRQSSNKLPEVPADMKVGVGRSEPLRPLAEIHTEAADRAFDDEETNDHSDMLAEEADMNLEATYRDENGQVSGAQPPDLPSDEDVSVEDHVLSLNRAAQGTGSSTEPPLPSPKADGE